MEFLLRTSTVLIVASFASLAFAQRPFDSSQADYAKGLPFTAIELKNENIVRVRLDESWYELTSIDGISVDEMIQKCEQEKWDFKRRIRDDLMQLIRLMGSDAGESVSLVLMNDQGKEVNVEKVKVSEENRLQARLYTMRKMNPFFSGIPNYPDCSPFSAIRWEGDQPKVKFRNQWYLPVSLDGIPYQDIVSKCQQEKWELKQRFTEDMVQILRLMGTNIDDTIDLELLDKDGVAHRFEQVKMIHKSLRLPRDSDRPARKLDVASVKADLDSLQKQLESQFAYLNANNFDYVAAIDEIRANAKDLDSESKLAMAIQKKVINQFIDGHASVSGSRIPGELFLPFLIEVSGNRYVAIMENRKEFVDSNHPYVEQIDGKSIGDWIRAAEAYCPKGSPQYRRRNGLRVLRSLPQLRSDLHLPESNNLSVVLAQKDADRTITVQMPLSGKSPTYRLWPRENQSQLMDEKFGYVRLPRMDDDAVKEIQHWMPKFKSTSGLIVDVRGNGGGIRLPLIELAGYLMRPEDEPRIGNVAKYRLWKEFDDDHLSDARYVYRETDSRFNDRERAAIETFKKTFTPEWEPEQDKFSQWHYLVLSKRTDDPRF